MQDQLYNISLTLHSSEHLLPLTKTAHKDDSVTIQTRVGREISRGIAILTTQGEGGGGNQLTNIRGKINICTAVTGSLTKNNNTNPSFLIYPPASWLAVSKEQPSTADTLG